MRKEVTRSVYREIGPDDKRSFSAFSDYLDFFIQAGHVASLDDLLDRKPDILGTILFAWFSQGQIACIFAQRLARKPIDAKWQSIVVRGDIDPELLSNVLEEAAEQLSAVQLIFPGSGSAQQAIDIVRRLCSHPSWTCSEIDWMPDEKGRSVQIGLRWHSARGAYTSWVLGIAPFDSMPFTRRFVGAPFIALVFRPSEPTEFAPTPTDESGKPASHLAHMDDLLGDDQKKRDSMTQATKRAKSALLGHELRSIARAKVSVSLPAWCKLQLADVLVSQPLKQRIIEGGKNESS
jgi:hypothetical protein